jgi:membrane protein YqaA with SNARE-associated domain
MLESLTEFARELVHDYGYVGIFLISYTESIIQPVPPDPFIAGSTALGLDPLLSAIVSTLASVLGGLTAHLLGRTFGEPLAKKILGEKTYGKGEELFNRYGFWAVLVAGFTPIPYKVVCWIAGIFEMGRVPFLAASLLGRFPRFLAVAFLGEAVGKWLML